MTTLDVAGAMRAGDIYSTAVRPRPARGSAPRPLARARWLVTAAQKESRMTTTRRPWGTVHIKRAGALFTACGEPAANWFVFWDYRLVPGAAETCESCGLAWTGDLS